ncbi:MAG TPA: sialate O-acetylesterase [Polyangiaceae bacterium]|nr:sialate O-acetylesterase [Polyangiaceae bacterium]
MAYTSRLPAVLAALGAFAASPAAAADPVLVFVLAGQSNMVGFGDGKALPPELASQPDVLYEHHNPDTRNPEATSDQYVGTTSTDWGPLEPKGTPKRYGPELTFGKAMTAALPGRTIAIVKMAQGGTNLREHWLRTPLGEATLGLPPDPEVRHKSQLYHALMGQLDSATYGEATGNALAYPAEPTRLDRALERLDQQGLAHELGAVLWMQGENEANSSLANAQRYGEWLSSFIAAFRQDLNAPSLRFVIGRVSDNLYAKNGGPVLEERSSSVDAVRAAQQAIADADPAVALIDTDDFNPRPNEAPGENFHFDSAAYQLMGQRFASAFLTLPAPAGAGGAGGAGGAPAGGAAGSGTGGGPGAGGAGPLGPSGAGGAIAGPAPASGGGDDDGCASGVRGSKPLSAALLAALVAGLAVLYRRRAAR